MKKLIFLWLMAVVYAFAIDKSSAIKALRSNPELLNTPEAIEKMQEAGVTKEQILKKLQSLDSNESNENNNTFTVENLISYSAQNENNETNATDENLTKEDENLTKNLLTPLRLQKPELVITKIRSLQQKELDKTALKRFGEKFFINKNSLNTEILSVPEYYQINAGDIITVHVFGGEDKLYTFTVDNKGEIDLPVVGPFEVAGYTFARLKDLLSKKLHATYPNATIDVNVKVHSYIQVTLSGYVNAPGIYNLHSLATVKDLLIAANGFGEIGSMRKVYLKRNGKVLKIIDFYQLIKNGDVVDTTLLQNGDIIYVPKAKNLVKLYGDVYTPAIYELKEGERVKNLLAYSGGLKPSASDKQIKLKRYEANNFTKIYLLDINSKIALKDGDEVRVYKISELNKEYVTVLGNVEKPGESAIPKSHLLKDLLKKLNYLKDTTYDYGLLERFEGEVVSFSLKDPKDIRLKSKDTIYIFNKYEVGPQEYVTVEGSVALHPGKIRYLDGLTLKDAINAAGYKETLAKNNVQIIRYDENLRPHIKFVDFEKNPNFKLQPYDEITLFDTFDFHPLKPILVFGEVNKPDIYLYSKDMTLKDALSIAGWFTDKADRGYIELLRYEIKNKERTRKIIKLTQNDLGFKLQPYDEISVKRIPKWYERKTVTIKGQVKYPGTYTIKTGDTLYDLIKRAGGFTKEAYLYGAVFTRESVRKQREKSLNEALYKLKKKVTIISASAREAGQQSLDAKTLIDAINSLIVDAQNIKPIGRIAIVLDKDLEKFKNSNYNIVLKDKDALYIPAKTNSIIVSGEVLTETTFVYNSDSALDYIKQAGGLTRNAEDNYFVVHANGFSEKGQFDNWFFSDNIKVKPGDVIVVPLKIKTYSWYGITQSVASVVYQLAVTAASLKTVGAL